MRTHIHTGTQNKQTCNLENNTDILKGKDEGNAKVRGERNNFGALVAIIFGNL